MHRIARTFGLALAGAMLSLAIVPASAGASTGPTGTPDTRTVVNVNLFFGREYNSAGNVYYQHQYSAWDPSTDTFMPCTSCGKIVGVTVNNKRYFVLRRVKGQQVTDGQWMYSSSDGSITLNGTWNGKRIAKHTVVTFNGQRVRMTIVDLTIGIYDPRYPEPDPCGPACGQK